MRTRAFGMTRRGFLFCVPAAAAGFGMGGLSGAVQAGLARFAGVAPTARLSLAYLTGSDRWEYLQGLGGTLERVSEETVVDEASLVAADTLPSGDAGFVRRGARVTIHGLTDDTDGRLPAMQMTAHYRPFHEAKHMVWGYEGSVTCYAQPPATFTMPVDAGVGLHLSLEVRPRGAKGDDIEPARADLLLSPGVDPRLSKLRRGAYLLAWDLPSGASLPAWSQYRAVAERIQTPEEGMPETRAFMFTDLDGLRRTLPVVMLTIDYADEPPV